VRHLRSILYALVLAPAAWILTGTGLTDDLHGRARQYTGVESFTGLLLLLLAGAAYAILLFSPISPAGPALSGLVYLGVGVWALVAPSSYAGVWSAEVTKPGFDLSRPGYGLAVLLAVPLICTALSARRWARYEPPQLPLIGTLGRARGAAAVAGTPVAAVTTQILRLPAVSDEGADATQVIRSPAPFSSASFSDDPTVVGMSGEPTEVVASDEPTSASASDEPTSVNASDEPTEVRASEEPTSVSVTDEPSAVGASDGSAEGGASEEPTTDVVAGVGEAVGDDEPTQVAAKVVDRAAATTADIPRESRSAADEPTEIAMRAVGAPGQEEVGTEPEQAVPDDLTAIVDAIAEETTAQTPVEPEVTEAVDESAPAVVEPQTAEAQATPQTAEAVEAAEIVEAGAEGETAAEPVAAETEPAAEKRPIGEKTAIISTDDAEKTQVIRLPVGEMPTRDFNVRPGERTQVIPRDRLDETQVIRLPQQRTESTDAEPTQVIRLGAGTVEPPGDRTQVLRLPTPGPAGDRTAAGQETVRQETGHQPPERPPSIAGAERPDPGTDPTTRLVPPQRPTGDEQPSDETTVDVGNGQRAMTVMNLERPAGELAADDTRPLNLPQDDDQTT
jgi:hypothetical protein